MSTVAGGDTIAKHSCARTESPFKARTASGSSMKMTDCLIDCAREGSPFDSQGTVCNNAHELHLFHLFHMFTVVWAHYHILEDRCMKHSYIFSITPSDDGRGMAVHRWSSSVHVCVKFGAKRCKNTATCTLVLQRNLVLRRSTSVASWT